MTTRSSGSVVEEGVDGMMVPERDGPAIAAAIARIVEDHDLRGRYSCAALATAARYGDEACGARFIAVIREIVTSTASGSN